MLERHRRMGSLMGVRQGTNSGSAWAASKGGRTPLAVGGLTLLLLVALSLHVGQIAASQGAGGVVRMHQQLAAVALRVSAESRRKIDEHKPAVVFADAVDGVSPNARDLRVARCAMVGALACPANHLIDLPPPVVA